MKPHHRTAYTKGKDKNRESRRHASIGFPVFKPGHKRLTTILGAALARKRESLYEANMDIRGNDLPGKGKQHGKAAAASNAPIAPSLSSSVSPFH